MDIDYKKLNKHYNTRYTIKDNTIKIGNLNDNQLEISTRILKSKDKPTIDEINQIKSMQFIMDYRSIKAIEKLQQDIKIRRLTKADKLTNIYLKSINNEKIN